VALAALPTHGVDPVAFADGRWQMAPLAPAVYLMLTDIGLAILGCALLSSDLASWIGWMLIASMVLLLVLTLIYRDMPPIDVLPGDPDSRNCAARVTIRSPPTEPAEQNEGAICLSCAAPQADRRRAPTQQLRPAPGRCR
jgi:hypothetical protein